jgi:hypothetical protein
LIGGGVYPHYPPNKFVLWDDSQKSEPFKIEYNTTPLRACLTKTRYVVVFERGIVLYKLEPDLEDNGPGSRIAIYETAPNPLGICCLGETKLAFPGRTKGQVQIVDLASRKVGILPAHQSPLRALALSKDEQIIATASDTGTLLRLWSTSMEARLFEFRRGLDHSTIFSISFSPSGSFMAVTSDKSTLHIFEIPRPESDKKTDKTSGNISSRSQSSSSKPVSVPSTRRPLSGTMVTSGSPGSPADGTSPTAASANAGKYKLGTSPTDRTSLTPSDYSAAHVTSPSNPSGTNWNDLARQQPQPSYRRPSMHSNNSSSPEFITSADLEGYKSSQRYGNIASYMPFAPKILSDTYSTTSCPFEMGNEPLGFPGSSKESKNKVSSEDNVRFDGTNSITSIDSDFIECEGTIAGFDTISASAWWRGGRPPKGIVSWIDEETLVIVGAGFDARWEIFVVGYDRMGRRGVERRGWRRILEDEGVD